MPAAFNESTTIATVIFNTAFCSLLVRCDIFVDSASRSSPDFRVFVAPGIVFHGGRVGQRSAGRVLHLQRGRVFRAVGVSARHLLAQNLQCLYAQGTFLFFLPSLSPCLSLAAFLRISLRLSLSVSLLLIVLVLLSCSCSSWSCSSSSSSPSLRWRWRPRVSPFCPRVRRLLVVHVRIVTCVRAWPLVWPLVVEVVGGVAAAASRCWWRCRWREARHRHRLIHRLGALVRKGPFLV